MSNFQVLFSGEVVSGTTEDVVRGNLARELGIDERKAKQLFTGRTVVIRSQMDPDEANSLQARLSELGAVCRVKDLSPKDAKADFGSDFGVDQRSTDYTLKDITAAHIECPRCGHMQLETTYCARCGVDIPHATKQMRKEDRIIEKKLRQLRTKSAAPRQKAPTPFVTEPDDAPRAPSEKRFTLARFFKKF